MKSVENYIVFCVENGLLEQQGILLAQSINRYLYPQYKAIAFSPRSGHFMSDETALALEDLNVIVRKEHLNERFNHYPIANKLLVMSHLEKQLNFDGLMFLDTDTLVTNHFHVPNDKQLLLRPVDNKGPGSTGENDENDAFWQDVFNLFELPIAAPSVTTTVDQTVIRGYFNAGLVWTSGLTDFYQQWEQDFLKLVDSGLRPQKYQSRDGNDFRCLDQVALAVTAVRYQQHLNLLPETYNYPIPFKPRLQARTGHPTLNELTHIHYHKWFQHPGFLDHITSEQEKQTEQYLWLKSHLPLQPEINGPFKC